MNADITSAQSELGDFHTEIKAAAEICTNAVYSQCGGINWVTLNFQILEQIH